MRKLKIVEYIKTCSACPAQWEMWVKNGRMIYVRYRYGHLTVNISEKPTEDVAKAINGKEILSLHCGDDYHGEMEIETLEKLTKGILDFSRLTKAKLP